MSPEEKNLLRLRALKSTPDDMLILDRSGEKQMFDSLAVTAKMAGIDTDNINTNTPGVDPTANVDTPNTPTGQGTAPQMPGIPPVPGNIPSQNPADKYATQLQPAKLINFKLKDLIDAELVVMILDMLLSWGAGSLLRHNGIDVDDEQLQADDFQKAILLKAFNPLFETYEVGTNNPAVGIALAMTAVYGKNFMNVIKENKRRQKLEADDKEYKEPKKTKAKYQTKTRKTATKKDAPQKPTGKTIQLTKNYL